MVPCLLHEPWGGVEYDIRSLLALLVCFNAILFVCTQVHVYRVDEEHRAALAVLAQALC